MDTLGSRLKLKLRQLEMKQKDLAEKLNISISTLNGYITDYREPDIKTLNKLAEALNTSVEYLINGNIKDDSPSPQKKEEKEPEAEEEPDIKWGDFGVSFSNGTDYDDLTDEEKDEITELLKFAIRQKNKKKDKTDENKK